VHGASISQCLECVGYNEAAALAFLDEARRWRLRFYQLSSALMLLVLDSDMCVECGPNQDSLLCVQVIAQKLPHSLVDEDEHVRCALKITCKHQ
jgi:hypothetical protein